jgi:hypothetical protein
MLTIWNTDHTRAIQPKTIAESLDYWDGSISGVQPFALSSITGVLMVVLLLVMMIVLSALFWRIQKNDG